MLEVLRIPSVGLWYGEVERKLMVRKLSAVKSRYM